MKNYDSKCKTFIKDEIQKLFQDSFAELKKNPKYEKAKPIFNLVHPSREEYGDWSANIAMSIAHQIGVSPEEVWKDLNLVLNKEIVHERIKKIIFVKPGFINFYLSKRWFWRELKNILERQDDYGRIEIGKGKKAQVEFISANPTGPLTLGNARGGFLGDALARVLDFVGYEAQREYYINDAGKQIEALGHSILGDAEAVYAGEYIKGLRQRCLKDGKIKDAYPAGEWAAEIILREMIQKTVERMGIRFDHWFSEKSLHKKGKIKEVIEEFKEKGYVQEKDGALWFLASQFNYGHENNRKDCVLVKKNGEFTYLAGDLAYHKNKFADRGFGEVINIWGADHYGDMARLQAGVEALGYKGKLSIILVQLVRLMEKGKEVRMSKRKGTYVTIDELLDEISLDVARFFFLMYDVDTHMDFDLDLARDTSEKNPVFYVQYAYARICSILRESHLRPSGFGGQARIKNLELLKHPAELGLARELARFPETIENIASDYKVHHLPYYAISLAEKFHQFYKECRVLGDNRDLSYARLMLTRATQIVLKNVLALMGISAPEKM
ncbi:MAG: arginine--tRNA ligase [Patescibacteria group bacterium]|nr:arginine--tRNA ligase [Patescibacteria group bacterium]